VSGGFWVYLVSKTAQVELRSGRAYAPAVRHRFHRAVHQGHRAQPLDRNRRMTYFQGNWSYRRKDSARRFKANYLQGNWSYKRTDSARRFKATYLQVNWSCRRTDLAHRFKGGGVRVLHTPPCLDHQLEWTHHGVPAKRRRHLHHHGDQVSCHAAV